jgi:hypothetical protein
MMSITFPSTEINGCKVADVIPYSIPGDLRTSSNGFTKLMNLYHHALDNPGVTFQLNFGSISFFDANMSAVLLAVLDELKADNQNKFIVNDQQIGERCEILRRNGFTSNVEGAANPHEDVRKTTVQLMTFRPTDADRFVMYIENDFLKHRGLEGKLLQPQIGKIKESYLEIFANVDLHAETNRPLYTCGQYYPTKREFKFTLTDVGVGFLKKITTKYPHVKTSSEAIDWALKGHSTKSGTTQGGTGLMGILRYCLEARGEFHIVSGDCYWVFTGTKIVRFPLIKYFCGTTVHLIFRY